MKERRFRTITILISAALAGIIMIQVLWIRNGYRLAARQYDFQVTSAVNEAVRSLNQRGMLDWFAINDSVSIQSWVDADSVFEVFTRTDTNTFIIHDTDSLELVTGSVMRTDSLIKELHLRIGNNSGHKIIQSRKHFSSGDEEEELLIVSPDELDSMLILVEREKEEVLDRLNDTVSKLLEESKQIVRAQAGMLDTAIRQLFLEINTFGFPDSLQFSEKKISEALRKELSARGIESEFEFAISRDPKGSEYLISTPGFREFRNHKQYKAPLYPGQILTRPEQLFVVIPGRITEIGSGLGPLMAGSLFFTLVIILAFYVTVRALLRQKKISEIRADFINNMTHELKTPVATIRLAADTIENEDIIGNPERIRHFSGMIRKETGRMNRSIERVIQVAVNGSEHSDFNPERVDIVALMRETEERFRMLAEVKGGTFVSKIPDIPVFVFADRELLLQALENLVDNALKYTGGKPPEVAVKLMPEGKRVILSVCDRGPGIPVRERSRVLEPFYRIPTGDVHNVKGVGLGLSLVNKIALLHGAGLKISDHPGGGCCVSIELSVWNEQ